MTVGETVEVLREGETLWRLGKVLQVESSRTLVKIERIKVPEWFGSECIREIRYGIY